MKELSIEEKAKRYDEALKRAKDFMNGEVHYELEKGENIMCCIFPELRKSEDERIRKSLINYIKAYGDSGDFTKEEYIAWIEKQGEKPQGKSALEAIKEEKVDNANKAEPKFKVGDWITDGNSVLHITNRDYGFYQFEDSYDAISIIDKNYYLWTVKDAKDGDVLVASDKSLFIYDGSINENGSVGFHIAFTKDMDNILNSDDGCGWEEKDSCHPATKEQRDQLEKALADVGWEFDFEKKELKKIEHEEYDGEDYGIDSLWYAKNILEKTLGKVDGYQTDDGILDHKCAISAVNKLYKQKPSTWSEDDEWMLNEAINAVIVSDYAEGRKEMCIDWLKSLKDKVQPQNKWKPSDEHYELEEFAKIVRGNLTDISKDVQALFENKYLKLTGKKMYGGYKD